MEQQSGAMRILVADDSEVVRTAICRYLGLTLSVKVCAEAKDAADAFDKAQALLPDAVLVDLSMLGRNYLEAIRALREKFPLMRILVMSQNDPELFVAGLVKAGADGMLDKSRLAAELIPALDRMRDGHSPPPSAS